MENEKKEAMKKRTLGFQKQEARRNRIRNKGGAENGEKIEQNGR